MAEEKTPKKNNNETNALLYISGIGTVLFLIAEIYCIHAGQDSAVILTLGVILAAVAGVFIYSWKTLIFQKLGKLQALNEEMYQVDKATYMRMKRMADQVMSGVEESVKGVVTGIRDDLAYVQQKQSEELYKRQMCIANIQIKRNKENTEAMLSSNDHMIEIIEEIVNDKLDEVLSEISSMTKAMMEAQTAVLQPAAEPEAEMMYEPEPETEPEPEIEPEAEMMYEPEPEIEPAAESEAEMMYEPEPEIESAAESEAEMMYEPEPEIESAAEPEAEIMYEPEPEIEPEAEAEVMYEPEPEIEPETEPEPEVKVEAAPEVDADPGRPLSPDEIAALFNSL